jgi:hypothetical protein
MDLIDQFSNAWPVGEPAVPSHRVALCNIMYSHIEFPEPARTAFVAKKYHHPYLHLSPNDTEDDMYETESDSDEEHEEPDERDEYEERDEFDEREGVDRVGEVSDSESEGVEFDGDE